MASSTALPTTIRKTKTPMMVPTTETITAVTAGQTASPLRKRPTKPTMKEIGSRIQPTMSAPGRQAKMTPMTAITRATMPTVLRPFFTGAGACCIGVGTWS